MSCLFVLFVDFLYFSLFFSIAGERLPTSRHQLFRLITGQGVADCRRRLWGRPGFRGPGRRDTSSRLGIVVCATWASSIRVIESSTWALVRSFRSRMWRTGCIAVTYLCARNDLPLTSCFRVFPGLAKLLLFNDVISADTISNFLKIIRRLPPANILGKSSMFFHPHSVLDSLVF